MKLFTLLFAVVLFASCKKELEPVTSVVDFSSTTYQYLDSFDSEGKANYLTTKDVISPNFAAFVNNTFPEATDLRKSHPELLSTQSIGDIDITQSSEVFMTFVTQGTVYRNTIGFYTYPTNDPPDSVNDIKQIIYIFPNAGGRTPLSAGDKVKLGKFSAGTSVGFVLLKDAYNPLTNTINNKAPHFCSNDVLNPERAANLKKHVVLVKYPAENKVLIGFEDIDRTEAGCDHDFNDVVVYATVNYK